MMRMSSLLAFLQEESIFDVALIFGANNRFYFANVRTSDGLLVVTKDVAYLLVDSRYFEECKKLARDCEVVLLDDLKRQLKELIANWDTKRIMVDISSVSAAKLTQIKEVVSPAQLLVSSNLDKFIAEKRKIKDSEEILCLKESQQLLDLGYKYLIENIRTLKTEFEVALELEFFLRKQGAQAVSFELMLLSGKNTSKPHGRPGDRKLQAGDLVLVDFGVRYNWYCSDMTRTFVLGHARAKHQEIYNLVLGAQNQAIEGLKLGRACREIDKLARDYIRAGGFGDFFGHGLGHGLGLEIHEKPTLGTKSEEVICPGMVFTIEPGIYLEGEFGVRIEDTIIATENGFENISKSPKQDLLIVGV